MGWGVPPVSLVRSMLVVVLISNSPAPAGADYQSPSSQFYFFVLKGKIAMQPTLSFCPPNIPCIRHFLILTFDLFFSVSFFCRIQAVIKSTFERKDKGKKKKTIYVAKTEEILSNW